MLLLVVLVTVIVVRGQTASANALLRTTAATADDVGDPPAGTWLALTGSNGTTASPGLPNDLNGSLARLRRTAVSHVILTEVRTADGDEFRVATLRRTRGTVQVVQDLAAEHAERNRLLKAMAVASALALTFALLLGLLLARRAVRPFARALALQRAFVADASHELRTPLTLLSTRAQLLDAAVQSSSLPDQVRADSTAVVSDVHLLGEVLEDLLVAADPRPEPALTPVGLDTVARDGVASALAHAQTAGVELRFADAARSEAGELHVRAAAAALRRAILALIDNAIDHTPPGGQVIVSCRRTRQTVVLAVSDTGPGVDPAKAPDLFRRFHSGGQRAGRAHYGLGLALTHDVANRLGGQLRLAESRVGATFELVLPAADSRLTGS
ncbi:MAG: sensor histidine kinase [Frankiales bacterium]|nr:sensor histidine kinase [Frankiales bacterium]